jgi:hypothetical protein
MYTVEALHACRPHSIVYDISDAVKSSVQKMNELAIEDTNLV